MGPIPQRVLTAASGVSQAMLVPIPEPHLENSASETLEIFHKKDRPTARLALLEGPALRQSTLPYMHNVLQDIIVKRALEHASHVLQESLVIPRASRK